MSESRRRRKEFRDRILLGLIAGLGALISRLSLRTAGRLGEAVGRLVYHVSPRASRRADRHLEIAFGDRLGRTERTRIAVGSFRLLGACALEWLVQTRQGREAAVRTVTERVGYEHLESALAKGKGVLIVTAHYGLFELMPVYVIWQGNKGKVVGRSRHAERGFEALIVGNRRRMGTETVPQTNAREMLRILRRGELLGTLPDQDVDKLPGIFVPFFGKDAYTPTGPASLVVTTGATMLPVFIERTGPARHRLVVHPPIPDPGGDRDERIRSMTAAYTRVFEEVITRTPEQWAWIHERWSTTPEKLARRRARRAREQARRTVRRLAQDRDSA